MVYRHRKSTDRSDAQRKTQHNNPLLLFLMMIPLVEIVAVLIIWVSERVVTLAKKF